MSELLWINDFKVLFSNNNYYKIIPKNSMSLNEKLNSITRFSFIFSVLTYLFTKNYLYLYIFVITAAILYLFNLFNKENFNINNVNNLEINEQNESNSDSEDSNINDDTCQQPTNNNPLMNVLISDDFKNKKKACNINDDNIKNDVSKLINKDLYFDVNTLYNKTNEYSYYTMPNTRVPNDQAAFANWLYNPNKECDKNYEKKKDCLEEPKSFDIFKNKLSNF